MGKFLCCEQPWPRTEQYKKPIKTRALSVAHGKFADETDLAWSLFCKVSVKMRTFIQLAVLAVVTVTARAGAGYHGHQPRYGFYSFRRAHVTPRPVCKKYPIKDPLGVCYKEQHMSGVSVRQCTLGRRYNPLSCSCDIPFHDPRMSSSYDCMRGFVTISSQAVASARASAVAVMQARAIARAEARANAAVRALAHAQTQAQVQARATASALAQVSAQAVAAQQKAQQAMEEVKAQSQAQKRTAASLTQVLQRQSTGDSADSSASLNAEKALLREAGLGSRLWYDMDEVLDDIFDGLFEKLFNDDSDDLDDDDFDFDDLFHDLFDTFDDLFDFDDDNDVNDDSDLDFNDDFYDDLLEDVLDNDGYDDVFDNDRYDDYFDDNGDDQKIQSALQELFNWSDDVGNDKDGLEEVFGEGGSNGKDDVGDMFGDGGDNGKGDVGFLKGLFDFSASYRDDSGKGSNNDHGFGNNGFDDKDYRLDDLSESSKDFHIDVFTVGGSSGKF
ncbi:uncharacterized protein LOC143278903 [Babylonia areolata]|uniref:uncharacterized protein LOC143278903 n=1 Tax=Babylonia areolata TaxID=304850 RepID=UPI003FD69F9E